MSKCNVPGIGLASHMQRPGLTCLQRKSRALLTAYLGRCLEEPRSKAEEAYDRDGSRSHVHSGCPEIAERRAVISARQLLARQAGQPQLRGTRPTTSSQFSHRPQSSLPKMNDRGRQPTSNRTKKACTECRQQKAKCDAYLHPDQPCSRCRKVHAKCVISDPFKREHKRKFFRDYAPFMPILDPHLSPNAYYAQSSLLFWVIIGVASRSYSKNPTLPSALARHILDAVLLSTASNSAALYKIQALLLLLTWPFPKMDVLFPLSGLLLHLAMLNGLHIPMSTHEFAKMKTNNLTEIDIHRRSELWAHCIIVYQHLFLGRLEWQWANQPLDSDTFYTTVCRLHIRVLHFYKGLSLTNDGCFSRLLATACTMIDLLRLLKSAISRDLDTERARSCLFKGINMLKTISVDRDDVTDMCATLLKQLWNSSKAFRKPDGTEHTTLRIRSRLTMSPLLDALWWWREEHDPSHKPVMPEDSHRDSNGIIPTQDPSAVASERPEVLPFLNDDFLADFEWALGNDYLFPPTEPYGTMPWSSTTNGV
ncbi:C6 transcription factor [Rasamsonia emersonii CBS 393.64]|uniref:C6 transcription factor n=1 Tax=Rasamsonia emersonii (strain ATCC 16479 / CBS 393.64 / IMI 116815) TaxID=1408163 RepID=A0A0F4YJ24_RASE3|nr:C6 transcription factor [Rasamsonia emersonii CBS 393.64]KKA17613.1 C6 transcription factor [Rasamsonia emersonii CBS 393.64]